MDYSNIFSYMQAEVTLIAVIVLLFLYDLIAGERGRRRFSAVACGLLAVQVLANVVPGTAGEVFAGDDLPGSVFGLFHRCVAGCGAKIRKISYLCLYECRTRSGPPT